MFPTSRLLAIVSQPFKRAQLGLFQGKTRQTGNSIPFSKHKTRRSWLPNVQQKRFFSDVLQDFVRVKVTTRAIKTIKKVRAAVLRPVCGLGCSRARFADAGGARVAAWRD